MLATTIKTLGNSTNHQENIQQKTSSLGAQMWVVGLLGVAGIRRGCWARESAWFISIESGFHCDAMGQASREDHNRQTRYRRRSTLYRSSTCATLLRPPAGRNLASRHATLESLDSLW